MVHEIVWGYTKMALEILGSIGITLVLIKNAYLWLNGKSYIHKVRKIDTTKENAFSEFQRLTNKYISNIIFKTSTSVFKNPFSKDSEYIWWSLYNMNINCNIKDKEK